jgi:hypothetical protein
MLATIVDWAALGKVILYSFVATLGLTTVFSFGIVGMARFDERRRTGSGAYAYLALALVCGLIVTAVLIEAIVIMTKK